MVASVAAGEGLVSGGADAVGVADGGALLGRGVAVNEALGGGAVGAAAAGADGGSALRLGDTMATLVGPGRSLASAAPPPLLPKPCPTKMPVANTRARTSRPADTSPAPGPSGLSERLVSAVEASVSEVGLVG